MLSRAKHSVNKKTPGYSFYFVVKKLNKDTKEQKGNKSNTFLVIS